MFIRKGWVKMKKDVEATFYFYEGVKPFDGYRPAHLLSDNYFTTGLHHYLTPIRPNGSGLQTYGTIAFLSPELYPKTMRKGMRIEMYEGRKKIGYAVIERILNPILEQ